MALSSCFVTRLYWLGKSPNLLLSGGKVNHCWCVWAVVARLAVWEESLKEPEDNPNFSGSVERNSFFIRPRLHNKQTKHQRTETMLTGKPFFTSHDQVKLTWRKLSLENNSSKKEGLGFGTA